VHDDVRDMRDTSSSDADVFLQVTAHRLHRPSATSPTASRADRSMWDVRDLDVSADGRKIVFAMRGPMIPTTDEEDPAELEHLGIHPFGRRCTA
jgi:hypothetical protein